MKPILSPGLLIACVSLLASASLLAQNPTTAAAAPNQPSGLAPSDEAKEKADDAALLQQLESSPDTSVVRSKTRSALKAGPGARGKGAGGGAVPMSVFMRQVGAPRSLLVRTTNPEPKSQADLEEDMAVMSHILDKAIEDLPGGQIRPMNALGVELAFPGAPIRSLYLDDYGAIFFLNVGFPLVAPPEAQRPEKPAADSAWEDAREELYGQHLPGAMGGEPAEEYSQEKIDKLKETLLGSLKNATNIRDLKPNEFVTVRVAGGVTGGGHALARRMFKSNPPGTLGGNFEVIEQTPSVSRRTVLTIRASKSQIDAFAKGSLTPDEFKKQARILAYSDDATGGTFEAAIPGGGYIGRARF